MRHLLLRLAFHIALVVGWWQAAAAQGTCILDTLFSGEGASRPVAIVPARTGALFFLDRSGQAIRLMDPAGRLRVFLREQDPLRTQERYAALALHPLYPDSPFVYLLVTHPVHPAMLMRFHDSASVAAAPETLWSAEEPGTTAGALRYGPDNTLILLLKEGGEQGAASYGKSTHVVFVPLSPGEKDHPDMVETDDKDIVDLLYDPSARLFYSVERSPDADAPAERAFVVYEDPELDTPLRQGVLQTGSGRALAMGGLALCTGDAFPRLTGSLLATGRGTTSLWLYRPMQTPPSDTASAFLSYGFGFSTVAVSATGEIYAVSGAYDTAAVLHIRPAPPRFVSVPPDTAWENREYLYAPVCEGTAPSFALQSAPAGMSLDTASWTLRWTPSQQDVRAGEVTAILVARNGAGTEEQRITLHVININDPPTPADLIAPADQSVLQFIDTDPSILFSWKPSADPDGDTIRYTLQLDTLADFSGSAPLRSFTGGADSQRVILPSRDGIYYWRVVASDGAVTTMSQPASRVLRIAFARTDKEKRERHPEQPSAGPVLEQNFPNPFNPTTSIKYSIPQSGHVRLSVYNLLGQELAVIFEGSQSEGTHEVEFSVDSLPSGIYFYRIQAPGLVETKKMVVTR